MGTEKGREIFFRVDDVFRSQEWTKYQNTSVRQEMEIVLSLIKPHSSVSLKRFGDLGDGGYSLAEPLFNSSVLISGGVGNNISFETEIHKEIHKIILIDFSVERPSGLPEAFVFLKRKIVSQAQSENEIDLVTLFSSLSKDSIILKLDIEGAEWEVLDSLTEANFFQIHQLVVEFHGFLTMAYENDLQRAISVLRKLDKYFYPVNTHANNYGDYRIFLNVPLPDVVEVTYVSKSQRHQYHSPNNSTEVNSPNNPNAPEIRFITS